MNAVPLTLKQANAYVARFHRHSLPVQGCRFAVGAEKDGKLVGVAIAGRPNARLLDDGKTLDVSRVCTDGTRNACSFLYARVVQLARLMGYRLVITYTLTTESGSSVKAARISKEEPTLCPGDDWNRPNRKRAERESKPDRLRWTLWRQE